MVSISFIGHMGDTALIAGVGLANMIVNIVIISGAYGMNGALETLVTQGFGAGKLDLCGVYLNCSRLVFTLFFVPTAIFLLFTEPVLVALGQNAEAASACQVYINYLLPGVFLTAMNDGQRRFLNSFGLSSISF
jgi:MATE family multidrug resistance protein